MTIKNDGDSIIVSLDNDLHDKNIPGVRDKLSVELKNNPDFKKISIDFDGITNIGSLGYNLIFGIYKEAASLKKECKIINFSSKLYKVAQFLQMPAMFPVEVKENGK